MADVDSLGFEIERRIIVFHRDTTMPDDTQLGFIGDPNTVINGNTEGETLLYNSPSGTKYLDKGVDPHERWAKVQDVAGGNWELEAGDVVDQDELEVETFTLAALDVLNMYIQLAYQPIIAEDTKMTIKNAPVQYYGDDYSQDAVFLKRITWEGLELEQTLSVGDKLTITYIR